MSRDHKHRGKKKKKKKFAKIRQDVDQNEPQLSQTRSVKAAGTEPSLLLLLLAGSCTFDEGFAQCDYQQDPQDDFDWTHINTQDVPYVSPDLPLGTRRFLSSLLLSHPHFSQTQSIN